MRIDIVTLFPEFLRPVVEGSILGRAQRSGVAQIELHDLWKFVPAGERADDAPYGGGAGMVMRLGDRAGAAHDFAGALDRDPRCTPAIVNLGNLALEANMLEEARSKYEAALRIDASSAMAHHNLGVVLRREGKISESIRELRLAASLESRTSKLVERWKAFWRRRA